MHLKGMKGRVPTDVLRSCSSGYWPRTLGLIAAYFAKPISEWRSPWFSFGPCKDNLAAAPARCIEASLESGQGQGPKPPNAWLPQKLQISVTAPSRAAGAM